MDNLLLMKVTEETVKAKILNVAIVLWKCLLKSRLTIKNNNARKIRNVVRKRTTEYEVD